jgi:hypothetical protein
MEMKNKLQNIISGHHINKDDAEWLLALEHRLAESETRRQETIAMCEQLWEDLIKSKKKREEAEATLKELGTREHLAKIGDLLDRAEAAESRAAQLEEENERLREVIRTFPKAVPNMDYHHSSTCMAERGWGDGPCNCGAVDVVERFIEKALSRPAPGEGLHAKQQAVIEAAKMFVTDLDSRKYVYTSGTLLIPLAQAVRALEEKP